MANTPAIVNYIVGFLVLAAVLGLPAVSSYLISKKTRSALKRKGSKSALASAVFAFIGSYLATLFVIIWAMGKAGLFRR
jgi:hypothetical protein